jgi:hypothetical protein
MRNTVAKPRKSRLSLAATGGTVEPGAGSRPLFFSAKGAPRPVSAGKDRAGQRGKGAGEAAVAMAGEINAHINIMDQYRDYSGKHFGRNKVLETPQYFAVVITRWPLSWPVYI